MKRYLRFGAHRLLLVIKRFLNDDYSYRASALAFTTLLSLVPLLVVIVYSITFLPMFSNIVELGKNYILSNFIPTSASSVQIYIQKFTHQATMLPTISIIFLFITALLLVSTIEETLNHIWHAPKRKKFYIAYLLYSAIILLLPIITGTVVFLLTLIVSLSYSNPLVKWLMHLMLLIIPVIVNTLIFTLLYIVVPNIKVPFFRALSGAFVAAVMLETARLIFTLYITVFPNYTLIYGVFAIIPIFLVWLYIFWFNIIFCALLITDH